MSKSYFLGSELPAGDPVPQINERAFDPLAEALDALSECIKSECDYEPTTPRVYIGDDSAHLVRAMNILEKHGRFKMLENGRGKFIDQK